MNKLIIIILTFFVSQAYAAPAMEFTCGGIETIFDKPEQIKFNINYSDWTDAGYTTQDLHFLDSSTNEVTSTIPLQDYRDYVNENNNCASLVELKSNQTKSGYTFYSFIFESKCGHKDSHIKIEAYCDKVF